MKEAGTHAVEEVEHGSNDDPQQCQIGAMEESKTCGDAA